MRKLTKKDVFQGGMGQKIFDLINDTYKDLYGYSELSQKQIDQLIKSYLGFLDFNLITCIEDWTGGEHKLIGVGITMPSLAHALRKCHRGRLLPFGWFHVLRAIKQHKTNIVTSFSSVFFRNIVPRVPCASFCRFDSMVSEVWH